MDGLIKLAAEVIGVVKEPVLLLVIVSLVFLLWHKDRCVSKELEKLSDRMAGEISCVNKVMAKQVTLLEVLIFRKDGK